MKFIINDDVLKEKFIKIEKHCTERLGKSNYAFFGQIKIRYLDEEPEEVELEMGLFVWGSPPKESAKGSYNEVEVMHSIIANRKSRKFEEEALLPLIK